MKKVIKILVAIIMVLSVMLPSTIVSLAANPSIKYCVHVQSKGWMSYVTNGKVAGTTGKGLRVEAIKIVLKNGKNSAINYKTHVAGKGWTGWASSGKTSGTTGQARAIEAIQIKLTGSYTKDYDIYYRMHVQNFGWLGWAKNGEPAGTTQLGMRGEAIQIKLVKKNVSFQRGGKAYYTKPTLAYKAHVQYDGWKNAVKEGSVGGTTGQGKALEGLKISFKDFKGQSGITYRAHVANIGWQNWVSSGKLCGTTGQGLAIQAVQIQLSSEMSKFFDVYYTLHVAGCGWLGWVKNGQIAGTVGCSIRAEAIKIKLVFKNSIYNGDIYAGQNLGAIWSDWGDYSPNGFTNKNKKGNCTWYADYRYSQVTGRNLVFVSSSSRNAKYWANIINKDYFNVLPTSNTANIVGRAIAVKETGSYGHVAYIEQVKDGMVYYTEDGESATRPSTWSKASNGNWIGPNVQACSLNEFKSKFSKIIVAK